MGNSGSKLNLKDALQKMHSDLKLKNGYKDEFWKQFWPDHQLIEINDLYSMITCAELRNLRNEVPHNFAQLVISCSKQLIDCSTSTFCNTADQQNVALNCCRLLTRTLPYVYEDEDFSVLLWSEYFLDEDELENEGSEKSKTKIFEKDSDISELDSEESDFNEDDFKNEDNQSLDNNNQNIRKPLASKLIDAICDLLFCPEFTVLPTKINNKGAKIKSSEPDTPPLELSEINSCEFIWQSGVGFTLNQNSQNNLISFGFSGNSYKLQILERNRIDLLRLLLVLFSETMYNKPNQVYNQKNRYIEYFISSQNRHCLPLFTSFLNTVLSHELNSFQFNFFNSQQFYEKDQLAQLCLQLLIVCLDHDFKNKEYFEIIKQEKNNYETDNFCSNVIVTKINDESNIYNDENNLSINSSLNSSPNTSKLNNFFENHKNNSTLVSETNLFINYLNRIHREEDFQFILNGFINLLYNPLISTYIPNSKRKLQFHQELLILYWKFCNLNKKFLYFSLKSSKFLEVLISILYYLNESKDDQSQICLIHVGVFIIFLLSKKRNFGVRLNVPFNNSLIEFTQIPVFTGTHADLLIIVFHKLITNSCSELQGLFECLLTIIVNISPYLKTLTMVSANKLLHFFEAFSTPWFLYCNENNHHLVIHLLKIFNNIIQYQFDGNSNLIYTILRKRSCFHKLANLPTDYYFICKSLSKSDEAFNDKNDFDKANNKSISQNNKLKKKSIFRSNSTFIKRENCNIEKTKEIKSVPGTPTVKKENNFLAESSQKDCIDLNKEISVEKENVITEFLNDNSIENNSSFNTLDKVVLDNKEKDESLNSCNISSISLCKDDEKKELNNKVDNSESSLKNNKTNNVKKRPTQSTTWKPTSEWVASWKDKLPLQTIMLMLQVLVPQVEKMYLDKGVTSESEVLKFLQHGTLVGLLPVPHPISISDYDIDTINTKWFRTYIWSLLFLRNIDPPIWYNTEVNFLKF